MDAFLKLMMLPYQILELTAHAQVECYNHAKNFVDKHFIPDPVPLILYFIDAKPVFGESIPARDFGDTGKTMNTPATGRTGRKSRA